MRRMPWLWILYHVWTNWKLFRFIFKVRKKESLFAFLDTSSPAEHGVKGAAPQ
jgi:hypothetical protein